MAYSIKTSDFKVKRKNKTHEVQRKRKFAKISGPEIDQEFHYVHKK